MSALFTAHHVAVGGVELFYTDWGPRDAPPVVMSHGLARTGRDFHPLAAALADRWRVVCYDTIGRGLSQWSATPERDYCYVRYGEIAAALCDALGFASVRWVGTSMGGALGMTLAAGLMRTRISHLVVNDIGPELAQSAVDRILGYVGKPPALGSVAEVEAYLRTVYKPYGFLPDSQWREMTLSSVRRRDDGRWTLHYDPRITAQFERPREEWEFWPAYERIAARTLLLRGAQSDLLTPDVARRMTECGPRARLVTVEGCGHAPALNMPDQIETVARFLAE